MFYIIWILFYTSVHLSVQKKTLFIKKQNKENFNNIKYPINFDAENYDQTLLLLLDFVYNLIVSEEISFSLLDI